MANKAIIIYVFLALLMRRYTVLTTTSIALRYVYKVLGCNASRGKNA